MVSGRSSSSYRNGNGLRAVIRVPPERPIGEARSVWRGAKAEPVIWDWPVPPLGGSARACADRGSGRTRNGQYSVSETQTSSIGPRNSYRPMRPVGTRLGVRSLPRCPRSQVKRLTPPGPTSSPTTMSTTPQRIRRRKIATMPDITRITAMIQRSVAMVLLHFV